MSTEISNIAELTVAQHQTELDDAETLEYIRNLIHDLNVDKMTFSEGMVSDEKREEYKRRRSGELSTEVVQEIHARRNIEVMLESLETFFRSLATAGMLPTQFTDLAVKISGQKVYIWVAVDTSTKEGIDVEMKTLRAYADVQIRKGSGISVMVVETDDGYAVPNGYIKLKDSEEQLGTARSIS